MKWGQISDNDGFYMTTVQCDMIISKENANCYLRYWFQVIGLWMPIVTYYTYFILKDIDSQNEVTPFLLFKVI